jgi:hypothetical protein
VSCHILLMVGVGEETYQESRSSHDMAVVPNSERAETETDMKVAVQVGADMLSLGHPELAVDQMAVYSLSLRLHDLVVVRWEADTSGQIQDYDSAAVMEACRTDCWDEIEIVVADAGFLRMFLQKSPVA